MKINNFNTYPVLNRLYCLLFIWFMTLSILTFGCGLSGVSNHVYYTVKPVLSGHPRSVRLIQGVRVIQFSIDNVIWGVKCHSNEQWKRLQYSRDWRYTFALISYLSKWTNWSLQVLQVQYRLHCSLQRTFCSQHVF